MKATDLDLIRAQYAHFHEALVKRADHFDRYGAPLVERVPALLAHIDALTTRLAACEAERVALRSAGDALAQALPPLMGAYHDGHDAGYTYVLDAMGQARAAFEAWRELAAPPPAPAEEAGR
jgi:hypothetical protein